MAGRCWKKTRLCSRRLGNIVVAGLLQPDLAREAVHQGLRVPERGCGFACQEGVSRRRSAASDGRLARIVIDRFQVGHQPELVPPAVQARKRPIHLPEAARQPGDLIPEDPVFVGEDGGPVIPDPERVAEDLVRDHEQTDECETGDQADRKHA